MAWTSVGEVRDALAGERYLADEALATAIFLAGAIESPLLLEGEAGVGTTEVARAAAAARRPDLKPHARAARRLEAPVPLSLDRLPDARARGRDRARAAARRPRGGGRARVCRRRPAARDRALQAARGRGDDRVGAGAA